MSLQESGEMYLETIYVLHKSLEIVRSIDLANAMNYSKPSISRAVHTLEDDGYLVIEEDGNLLLTEKGLSEAEQIFSRHVFFSNYFIALGIEPETAISEACTLEHSISHDTFLKMKEHISQCLDLENMDYYSEYILKNQKES